MPNKEIEEIKNEMKRGALMAAIDVITTWPIFVVSALRSADATPTHPLLRDLAQGKPFFKTIKQALKQNLWRSLQSLYVGSGTYYMMTYAPLVITQFAVHNIAKQNGLSEVEACLLAATFGSIIGTPGDTLLIRHQSARAAWNAGYNPIREARGFLPTMGREVSFAFITQSGIQKKLADYIPHAAEEESWSSSLLRDTAASIAMSPLILTGQPFNRVARVTQERGIGFFAAHRAMCQSGRDAVNQLPVDAAQWKRISTFIAVAYFTGGLYRVYATMLSVTIFGVLQSQFKRMDEKQAKQLRFETSDTPRPY